MKKEWLVKTLTLSLIVLLISVNFYGISAKNVRHGWDITKVDTVGNVGQYSSLAIDSEGYPCISYYNSSSSNLQFARYSGTEWNIEVVDDSEGVGWYTSLALDELGYPHISYYDYINGDLKYAFSNESGWTVQTLDSDGNVGLYPSLALDNLGKPYISYYDESQGNLKCYKVNNSVVVDSTGDVGNFSSLELDSNYYPHISYYDVTNQALKYALWDDNTWVLETVNLSDSIGMQQTCIDLDSEDKPYISFRIWNDIMIIHWDGSEWVQVSCWWFSEDTWQSLVIDSDDSYHFCLYFGGDGTLYYSGALGSYLVDWDGDVGNFASIALDENDTPMISYYDAMDGDLRFAYWSETANRPPYAPGITCYYPFGYVGFPYDFFTSTKDPEHDDVYFWFDWDDGNQGPWLGPYETYEVCFTDHVWTEPGIYNVRVKAKDTFGAVSKWSEPFEITIVQLLPAPSTPAGPDRGYYWAEYTYQTIADNPYGHPLCYEVDWGDGIQEYLGWYPSGVPVNMSHIWMKQGEYAVKVRVWDAYGGVSFWSSALDVTIQETFQISVNGGFGIRASIKNQAPVELSNINVSIQVFGGMFNLVNKTSKEVVSVFEPGAKIIKLKPFIGLGSINIQINVTFMNESIGWTSNATQILFWTII
jgi:hypothetical protein